MPASYTHSDRKTGGIGCVDGVVAGVGVAVGVGGVEGLGPGQVGLRCCWGRGSWATEAFQTGYLVRFGVINVLIANITSGTKSVAANMLTSGPLVLVTPNAINTRRLMIGSDRYVITNRLEGVEVAK